MMMKQYLSILCLVLSFFSARGQEFILSGKIVTAENKEAIEGAKISLKEKGMNVFSDAFGTFTFPPLPKGDYTVIGHYPGLDSAQITVRIKNKNLNIRIFLASPSYSLHTVSIKEENTTAFGLTRLNEVEGTAIYAAKKNEVVLIQDITANLATNNSRQVYAKIPGLNIWESDGAGVQLGIGGRGLSPNRNSNFNTRQNGYDISADALGYPESYYTPPVEAIERIEIVRGAASLQYGTQFGGMLNFKFKEGPEDKKIEGVTRQTLGSFGLFSSFNSLGGTIGKVNYYGFYQYKKSKGWRPNASLEQHTAYASMTCQVSPTFQIRPEFSYTTYLAQQPGGLTDAQFAMNPRQSNRERNWFKVDWNLFAVNLDYTISPSTRINSRSFALLAGRDALGNLERINLVDFGGNRDFLSDDFRNWGNESRLIHRYEFNKQTSVFLTGFRYYDGFTQRKQGEGNNGRTADFTFLNPERLEGSDFDLPSKNVAVFAENIFNLSPKLSLTPGVRFEYIHTQANGYYREISQDLAGNVLTDSLISEDKSNRRSFLFGGLGISYKPHESLEFYTNFSQNYRAINFNDIRVNVGSLVVDPNLKDERGFNVDLGFRGEWNDWVNFDLSVFHLAYRDRIGTVLRKEPNPLFNNLVDRTFRFRTNIADAEILGFEAYAEIDVLNLLGHTHTDFSLQVFGNFAAIEANYVNAQQNGVEGNSVELVPPINLKAGLSLAWENFKSTFQYSYVAEHFSDASNAEKTPTAIEGIIPSYQVIDLSMSYSLRKFKLETGINNVLNRFYFTRRATGYPGPGIIPSDGRSFYLTLEVKI